MTKETVFKVLPWVIASPFLIPFAIIFIPINALFDLAERIFGPDEVPF